MCILYRPNFWANYVMSLVINTETRQIMTSTTTYVKIFYLNILSLDNKNCTSLMDTCNYVHCEHSTLIRNILAVAKTMLSPFYISLIIINTAFESSGMCTSCFITLSANFIVPGFFVWKCIYKAQKSLTFRNFFFWENL